MQYTGKLLLIFTLAFILRFWHLGLNPPSLDWDEASLGYNAYSILKTGRDEYGTFLPFSIRSFGDYKPPLYTYLTILPVAMWGMTEFSVRFVSALFGTLTVVVCFFLSKTVFVSLFAGRSHTNKLSLLASFFLAASPWHIQFSRVAFEANVGIFFFITGVWLFLRGMKRPVLLVFSCISFALSMYAYHSPRLVIPLFLIGAGWIYRSILWEHRRWVIVSCLFFAVLLLPIAYEFRSATAARFGSVTLINPSERLVQSIPRIEYDQSGGDRIGVLTHNRRLVYARDILAGYLDHFNVDFLFLTGDAPGRHHAPGMGMLYFFDLFLVPVGVYALIRRRAQTTLLLCWWFLAAPAASALTSGTPHAVRALLYLPTYQILSAVGLVTIWDWLTGLGISKIHIKIQKLLKNSILLFSFFIFIFSFYYYLVMYWIHGPVEYASEWQYGYKQTVETAAQYENQVDRIIVTYRYDQPYVFFLFYHQVDPAWYQQQWFGGAIERFNRNFGIYEFRNLDWERDKRLTNVLLVGTAQEIPENATGRVTDIHFPDGSVAFRIVKR